MKLVALLIGLPVVSIVVLVLMLRHERPFDAGFDPDDDTGAW